MKNFCAGSQNLVSLTNIDELLEKITLADETQENAKPYYEAFDKKAIEIEARIKVKLIEIYMF